MEPTPKKTNQLESPTLRKVERQGHPPIYIAPSGAQHVRASELVLSKAGRDLLASLAKLPLKMSVD
jgi:hypothetical protein